jgi:ribosomal protein L29
MDARSVISELRKLSADDIRARLRELAAEEKTLGYLLRLRLYAESRNDNPAKSEGGHDA